VESSAHTKTSDVCIDLQFCLAAFSGICAVAPVTIEVAGTAAIAHDFVVGRRTMFSLPA
jgi:hypothetical protein